LQKKLFFGNISLCKLKRTKRRNDKRKGFCRLLGYWEDKIAVLNYKVERERRTEIGGIFINPRLTDSNRYRYFSTNPN
jgi:hypothetical protein